MKRYIWLIAAVVLAGGIIFTLVFVRKGNSPSNLAAKHPLPHVLSVQGRQDTASLPLTVVNGTIQNQGGEGNVFLNAQVWLHGKLYQRHQQIFMKENESKDVHFEFVEVPREEVQPSFAIYAKPAEALEAEKRGE
jgi:hypothetical protein